MSAAASRIFYIENLGCAKNQVDGEALASVLMDRGWRLAARPEEASLIIVNTCGFIEAAKKESLESIMGFRRLYPRARIIAAGCLAERYGIQLSQELPEADGVFGNRDLSHIAGFAESLTAKSRAAGAGSSGEAPPEEAGRAILLPRAYKDLPPRKTVFSPPGCVYIKAAEGCDNGCSFCAIPLIRGPLRSRPPEAVAAEIKNFLLGGVGEFNLVAQDLGSYGHDTGATLPRLLRAILDIEGDFRLRLLYIHPEHFPPEVLRLCREDARLLPYFDLPFQHAARPILKAMGRNYDMKENLRLVDTIRQALPDAVIRSTFLLGFPGERETDFQELLEFQEKAAFDWLGCFTYSPEEGAAAYGLYRNKSLRVPAKTAAQRKKLIEQNQTPITEKRLDRFVGRQTVLLVEEAVAGEKLCLARAWFQAPEVDGLTVLRTTASPGDRIRARLIRRNGFDMEAVAAQEINRRQKAKEGERL
jgi:ribosomal protein S12 methylthiotransferase